MTVAEDMRSLMRVDIETVKHQIPLGEKNGKTLSE
jgi:hypothetical protein